MSATRRDFLKTGALVIGFTLVPRTTLAQSAALPGSLNANRRLDAWLRIDPNGTVTIFTGKIELGQGIGTALSQIAADELDVDLKRIDVVYGDTARTPNEGQTAGSLSVEQSGTALRYACAEARGILLGAAAAKLGLPVANLTVTDGTIAAPSGPRTTYWELSPDANFDTEATAKVKPKPASEHRVVGTSVRRRDIPKKFTGGAAYVQDVRLPGMVFGRVVRPPSPGAELIEVDETRVRSLPGVVAVVRDGRFLAVAAAREEQAIRAREALRQSARWKEVESLPPSGDALYRDLIRASLRWRLPSRRRRWPGIPVLRVCPVLRRLSAGVRIRHADVLLVLPELRRLLPERAKLPGRVAAGSRLLIPGRVSPRRSTPTEPPARSTWRTPD